MEFASEDPVRILLEMEIGSHSEVIDDETFESDGHEESGVTGFFQHTSENEDHGDDGRDVSDGPGQSFSHSLSEYGLHGVHFHLFRWFPCLYLN